MKKFWLTKCFGAKLTNPQDLSMASANKQSCLFIPKRKTLLSRSEKDPTSFTCLFGLNPAGTVVASNFNKISRTFLEAKILHMRVS